jgi:hypothetical protein
MSNVFDLTVCFNLTHFVFHIFPLLIPKKPAGFTSYIVHLIPFISLGSVTTAVRLVFFGLIIKSILHLTMAYASSIHNNPHHYG